MGFEILKGTQDFEPSKQIILENIFSMLKSKFQQFGFRPFDTPMIEYLDTLTYKYDVDAEIVNEVFKVKDRGDRELGLRYDLTTPLCRYVAMHRDLKKPFRRYHMAKVFRDGPIKKGRMREFYQCDCDVVGVTGIGIEAELLELFSACYKELNIDAVVELNNHKILKGVFMQAGSSTDEREISEYILCVDKLKKIKAEGVLKEITEKKLDVTVAKKALELFSAKSFIELENIATNSLLKEGIIELRQLVEAISGVVPYRLNFSMSRGLAIYTGNIWESYEANDKIPSSLGSGGRYDNVIGEYQNSTDKIPAVGISIGIEPVMTVLESSVITEGVTETLIVPLGEEFLAQTRILARTLRSQGKNVEIFYGYKLPKGMEYAKYLGARELIVLGKRDIEAKKCIIKNLVTNVETTLSF